MEQMRSLRPTAARSAQKPSRQLKSPMQGSPISAASTQTPPRDRAHRCVALQSESNSQTAPVRRWQSAGVEDTSQNWSASQVKPPLRQLGVSQRPKKQRVPTSHGAPSSMLESQSLSMLSQTSGSPSSTLESQSSSKSLPHRSSSVARPSSVLPSQSSSISLHISNAPAMSSSTSPSQSSSTPLQTSGGPSSITPLQSSSRPFPQTSIEAQGGARTQTSSRHICPVGHPSSPPQRSSPGSTTSEQPTPKKTSGISVAVRIRIGAPTLRGAARSRTFARRCGRGADRAATHPPSSRAPGPRRHR